MDPKRLSVSYVSSFLRVLQAALREVARSDDGTRQMIEQPPRPLLLLSEVAGEGSVTLRFTFADPTDSTPLNALSSKTFDAFLDRFTEFVRALPQPGLWGGAARGSHGKPLESELARRMDQVHRELRRSPRVAISFGGRTVQIERDRMEIT